MLFNIQSVKKKKILILITFFTTCLICLTILIYPFKESTPQTDNNENIPQDQQDKETENQSSKIIEDRSDPIQTIKLRKTIEDILAENIDNYAVYIEVLDENFIVGINENELFYPASIYKVPIAILVLRDIEAGKYSFNTQLELLQNNKFYTSDTLYHIDNGTMLSVDTLLHYMICYSDNSAWDMLMDNLLGTTAEIDERIHNELELEYTRRVPFQTTAKEVGEFFSGLYNYKYLSPEYNDYLLDLLCSIIPSQNDRIPAGLPEGTKAAHKIGTWIGIHQDGGIVYSDKYDFIIVVLNKNTSVQEGRKIISQITQVAWEYLQID